MNLIQSLATACLSLVGLAYLSSQSITNGDYKTVSRSKSENSISILLSCLQIGFSDWTTWIGTAWILARQQNSERNRASSENPSSESSLWQFLSDFSFVSLLLLLRRTSNTGSERGPSMDDGTNMSNQANDDKIATSSSSSTERLLRQIETNLGLTPRTHNRTNQPNLGLPLAAGLNLEGGPSLSSVPSVVSLQEQKSMQTQPVPQQQRYLELLVHNVSHTDLVLSLEAPHGSETLTSLHETCKTIVPGEDAAYCLCRPRFSAFDAYSRRLLQTLNSSKQLLSSRLIYFPQYNRSDDNHCEIQMSNTITDKSTENNKLPIGFNLQEPSKSAMAESLLSVSPQERSDLRVRGRDAARLSNPDTPTKLNAVFFPLLGMLLPQWQAQLEEKYGIVPSTPTGSAGSTVGAAKCKKVVVLVSGVGSPRNWTHSMDGNSTEHCAKLMELLIHTLHPDWVVVHVHSNTNVFRYDENISFVQNELLPCIQSYRDAHATGLAYPDEVSIDSQQDGHKEVDHLAFDPEWHKTMSVTLSFADGSPARNHAIQAALRSYKPTYFHCWQLKTFWHELKIVDSDIEVHTFEEMETLPPIDLTTSLSTYQFHQQQPIALQVVEEMKIFKAEMEAILKSDNDNTHDIRSFWLRKTRKPVLAVLAVQMRKGGPVKLYRGTNMEVSMPTGSLCAERNVIGSALADNPTLKRHHLKIIAVLSVPVTHSTPTQTTSHTLPRNSSGASLGSISGSIASRSNSVDVTDTYSSAPKRPPRPTSRSSSGEWLLEDIAPATSHTNVAIMESNGDSSFPLTPPFLPDPNPPHSDSPGIILGETSLSGVYNSSTTGSPNSTPVRRISLYQHQTRHKSKAGGDGNATRSHSTSRGQSSKRRTVVVVQSSQDLNPLRPCGACNEWLKKIAETNPYFQILTFTDKDCNGVYCTPCAE